MPGREYPGLRVWKDAASLPGSPDISAIRMKSRFTCAQQWCRRRTDLFQADAIPLRAAARESGKGNRENPVDLQENTGCCLSPGVSI
ncbi:MAG: hypothetical protein LBE84_03515 [Planctomycetota bacterium]|jgi:hypothetical protein|nr:hypothetical protein [Planctomycetota bacterium]